MLHPFTLRFLSMSWVLIGHAYTNWMQGIFVNNPNVSSSKNNLSKKSRLFKINLCKPLQWLFKYMMEHGEFAVISNALPSVDSFFLIGELLFLSQLSDLAVLLVLLF